MSGCWFGNVPRMLPTAIMTVMTVILGGGHGFDWARFNGLGKTVLEENYIFSSPTYDYGDPDYSQYMSEKLDGFQNLGLGNIGCPEPRECDPNAKYRSYDGSCNNLKNPIWGVTNTAYERLLPNRFADGVHAYRTSVTGKPLPQPRMLSNIFLRESDKKDFQWDVLFVQFGEIVAHDLSHAMDSEGAITSSCCSKEGPLLNKTSKGEKCNPPLVSIDDKLYKKYGQRCFDFRRGTTDVMAGCTPSGGEHNMLTDTTHYIDASFVYGSDEKTARSLRLFKGGQLKSVRRHGKEWLSSIPWTQTEGTCMSKEVCYKSGDSRINQNPGLAQLHIIFFREHNRLAKALSTINPHWNDERLYQESRRILIAEFQHIMYYEWYPGAFGLDFTTYYHHFITPTRISRQYKDQYYDTINPTVMAEFAHSAVRFMHTAIVGNIKLMNEGRVCTGSLRVSEHMRDVSIIEKPGVFEDMARGMTTAAEHLRDAFIDPEVKSNIFRNPKFHDAGMDLISIDILRGRDAGLGTYNDYRELFGFRRATKFTDFKDLLHDAETYRLSLVYEHPDDVDLYIGGFLEGILNDQGTIFGFIIEEQLKRTRSGDRFFYEFSTSPYPFTPDQLAELRKATIARIFCDNVDDINHMQPRAFAQIKEIRNPLVRCDNYHVIPQMNLGVFLETI